MKTRILTSGLAFLCFELAATLVAQAVTRFRCYRCGFVQTYTHPGIYKCPADGSMMVLMR